MRKEDVRDYFNRAAAHWDDYMIRDSQKIDTIFYHAGIQKGVHVLDVACGTGVLFPDYEKHLVASVTAIDISPEMVKISRTKYPHYNIICGDVETTDFAQQFDCVMVYDAFPHFPDPERLISKLSLLAKPGGTVTVAHSMSRERLNHHHSGSAHAISLDLMEAADLQQIFSRYLTVTTVISDNRMYQVTGIKPL